ncbi:MAG: tryptophan-rich sensory protein [Chloracidobacterium sp.]|nr:tryptophan-rich sensory protein [Chloracidobacterium sp.]
MTQSINSQDRIRSVLVLIATIATITFNLLAAGGYVNGVSPDMISNKYPTVITPAGYAFTMWSLIYVGIIAFSVYQLLPNQLARFRSVRTLYVISCLLNCAWIYFWHREQIAISFGLIVALCLTLVLILRNFRDAEDPGFALLTKAPFGFYAGWVAAASIVNLAVVLKWANVEMTPRGWNIFGVVCILAAAALAIAARVWLRNYLFPLAIAWAVSSIAVKQSGNTAIVVAAAVATVIGLVTAGSIVTSLKDSTTKNA